MINREIKFRAFDDGKMIYEKNILHLSKEDNQILRLAKFWCNIRSDSVVMQYTGLKDKNGKEIYEGDILRKPAKDKWEKINYSAFEVFFHDNDRADNHIGFQMGRMHNFGSVCGGFSGYKFLPKTTSEFEIIGNIYENPELLKYK